MGEDQYTYFMYVNSITYPKEQMASNVSKGTDVISWLWLVTKM